MPGRKIRDERDALDCLARYERSGLEFREWLRRNHVDGRSLQCWRIAIENKRPPVRLVELVTEPQPAAPASKARYLIRTGAFEVELGADFDQDTLFKLLEVVAAC